MSVNRHASSLRFIVYAILSLTILHEVFPPRFSCQRLSTLTMPHDIAISRYFTMTMFRDILRARLSLIPIAMPCLCFASSRLQIPLILILWKSQSRLIVQTIFCVYDIPRSRYFTIYHDYNISRSRYFTIFHNISRSRCSEPSRLRAYARYLVHG